MENADTLETLFKSFPKGIRIPHIQREYAQGRLDEKGEIIRRTFVPRLVESVFCGKNLSLDFIYGVRDDSALLPLDGQQRLTTLFLLAWCCKKWNKDWCFEYESRRIPEMFVRGLIENPRCAKMGAVSQILDSEWFLPIWEKDSTVAGMLKMIETIDEAMKSYEQLEPKMENVKFFLHTLDGENNGFDRIFRKMNARGKELTPWENLKAVLDDSIPDKLNEWKEHINGDWPETVWRGVGGDIGKLDRFMERVVRVAYARFAGWSHFGDALDQIERRISGELRDGNKDGLFGNDTILAFFKTAQSCFSVLETIALNWAEDRTKNALWDKKSAVELPDSGIWKDFGNIDNPTASNALRLLYLAEGCTCMNQRNDICRKTRLLLNIVDVEKPGPDKFDSWSKTGLDFLRGKFDLLNDTMTKTFGESNTGQLADERRKWTLPEKDIIALEQDELVKAGSLRFVFFDKESFDSVTEIRRRLDLIRNAIENAWPILFDALFARIALTWKDGIPAGRTVPIPHKNKSRWRDEFFVRAEFVESIRSWLAWSPMLTPVPSCVVHIRELCKNIKNPLNDFERMKEADGWLWLIVGKTKRTEAAIRLDLNDKEASNRKQLLVDDAIRYRSPWPWFKDRNSDVWYRVDAKEKTWWESTNPTKYKQSTNEKGNTEFVPIVESPPISEKDPDCCGLTAS